MATDSQDGTTNVAHGVFYWNELVTRDIEAAKAFYAETIGWRFEDMPMDTGTYVVAKV